MKAASMTEIEIRRPEGGGKMRSRLDNAGMYAVDDYGAVDAAATTVSVDVAFGKESLCSCRFERDRPGNPSACGDNDVASKAGVAWR
jgi:hypothetical protein